MSKKLNPIKAIVEGIVLIAIATLIVWVVFYREDVTERVNKLVGANNSSSQSAFPAEIESQNIPPELQNLSPEELAHLATSSEPQEFTQKEYQYSFTVPDGLSLEERAYFAGAGDTLPNHIVALRQTDSIDEVISLSTFKDDGSGLAKMVGAYLDNQGVKYAPSNIQSAVLNESMGEARNMIGDTETFWFFFHPKTGNFHVLRFKHGDEALKEKTDELIASLHETHS